MTQTRCPQCGTTYQVEDDGHPNPPTLASCSRCGASFSLLDGQLIDMDDIDPVTLARTRRLNADSETSGPTDPAWLSFDFPENTPPLEVDPEVMLDDSPAPEREPYRPAASAFLTIAVVLCVVLLAQMLWLSREALVNTFPALEPACEWLRCTPDVVDAPDHFRVLERGISAASRPSLSDAATSWLTLNMAFRNEAPSRQHYPDLYLSLLDNNGTVLIRRRLEPEEYLDIPLPDEATIAPGEVTTLSIDFADPGYQATGFAVDFR